MNKSRHICAQKIVIISKLVVYVGRPAFMTLSHDLVHLSFLRTLIVVNAYVGCQAMSALLRPRRARTSKVLLSPTKSTVLRNGESRMQCFGVRS